MPTLPADTDVLIVGAGPTGLTLATSLAQLGVDHVLIDRNAEPQAGSKAAAVQPRALEFLDRLGVADGLVADGLQGQGFQVHDGERTLLRLPYTTLDTPFPFLLQISQQATEGHLARRLTELGGTIHRNHRLITCHADFPGVTAAIASPDGTVRAIQTRYLIGCDGLHSRVRAEASISFPGDAPEELFALADVRLQQNAERAQEEDATFFFWSPEGMLVTSPLPGGLLRVVAAVPPGTAPPSAGEVEKLLDTRGRGKWRSKIQVSEIVAASTYHVQERVAGRLSDGPIFLAGDAAHTHSPAGGQGMNTGIQDAGNLAWKLHDVIAGSAPTELLDTYHKERHPVATALVAFTSQLNTLATLREPASRRLRNDVIAAGTCAPGATDWLAQRLSQLDVSYATEITEGPGSSYRPGQRIPPSLVASNGLIWTLAVPKDAVARVSETQPERLNVQIVDGLETTLLVRPDGYLAACGVPTVPDAVLTRLGSYALGEQTR